MTGGPEDLDFDFFEAELTERFPPSLRPIFQTRYADMNSSRGLVVIVPSELATYFALSHPRTPAERDVGIKEGDGIILLSNELPAETLAREVRRAPSDRVVADLRLDPVASEHDEEGMKLRAAQLQQMLLAVGEEPSIDLLLDEPMMASPLFAEVRQTLLRTGKVSDLFDGGDGNWYVGWYRDNESSNADPTQVARVPPADEFPSFLLDLESSWHLWRWGYLVKLPLHRPWLWEEFKPDDVSMIKRLREQVALTDTSAALESAAYLRIVLIETSLRYLVRLVIGDDPDDLWPLLKPKTREEAGRRWAEEGRGSPENFLDLIAYKEILYQRRDRFSRLFTTEDDPEALPDLTTVNNVRKRVMHAARQAAQPVTKKDMVPLDRCLSQLEIAIERAETSL